MHDTRQIPNTTPDSAIVGRTRVLIITPMPDSGAPPKMNLRPSATKIRGIQQTSERLTGDGRTIFEHACKLGLEGIVFKRINAPYRSGKVKT